MEESASKPSQSRTEEIVLVAELERVEHGGPRGPRGPRGAAGDVEILGGSGEADVFDVAEVGQLPVLSFEREEIVDGEGASRGEKGKSTTRKARRGVGNREKKGLCEEEGNRSPVCL